MEKPEIIIRRRILVIEDDLDQLEVLRDILEEDGYDVETASTGAQALEQFQRSDFHAVVSDIQLNDDSSGIQLMESILKIRKLPYILITGFGDLVYVQEAHYSGATGFLEKPFNPLDLLDMLSNSFGPASVVSEVDELYHPIRVDDFASRKTLVCDVFLKLDQGKYTKFASKGESPNSEKVKTLKTVMGLNFLYVLRTDEYAWENS